MKLSIEALKSITLPSNVEPPAFNLMNLPERVLQFGTGVLLRALPNHFIDQANKKNNFQGRIVVVKSTQGDTQNFNQQNCLYTICERGVENQQVVERNYINSSISRVINANYNWNEVLQFAESEYLKIIISNTTEAGIQLIEESIFQNPPSSFPAKLLAILYQRYNAFGGELSKGCIIIPTELIEQNGKVLERIVLQLAHLNKMDLKFIDWLEKANTFCNSLVDRIVPGKPVKAVLQELYTSLGYEDELITLTEPFKLWVIEGDEQVQQQLTFAHSQEGITVTTDIEEFKELKLRLLNGTHSLVCATALLSKFQYTAQTIANPRFKQIILMLMQQEIAPSLLLDVDDSIKQDYIYKVLDRFSNTYIQHQWQSISVQYSLKMKNRVVPLIKKYFEDNQLLPELMSKFFAAFLVFMRPIKGEDGNFYSTFNKAKYSIQDQHAEIFSDAWFNTTTQQAIQQILSNEILWGEDLTKLPNFYDLQLELVNQIVLNGIESLFLEEVTTNTNL